MKPKKEILQEIEQALSRLPVVPKNEIESVFQDLANRRGYREKIYKPLQEILAVTEKWIDSEIGFYGNSVREIKSSLQGNQSIEILLIHNKGFNACVLFKTNVGLILKTEGYCFLGSIRDPENDQPTCNDLGIKAQDRGDFATALVWFEKGFKIGNSSQSAKADIKDRMATCCMILGRYKDAVKYWEEALTMKNWYPDERAGIEADLRKAKARV